jgi:predicted negative regulator of RcsB-dependent stress response
MTIVLTILGAVVAVLGISNWIYYQDYRDEQRDGGEGWE